MGKPTSALSTAISIRIPNDLRDAVAEYALSRGFINESGRLDKRGQPNLSAAVANLLKQALKQVGQETSPPVEEPIEELSDSVNFSHEQPLAAELAKIETKLIDRVCDTISQQLSQLFSHHNLADIGIIHNGVRPARSHSEMEPNGESNSAQNAPAPKEDTKDRILQAVSRGFRSRGYNGISVDALAKDAGVTSGAFYGYFRSKEEAFLAAVVDGLDEYRAGIEAFRANYGADWSAALADYYLGRKHREDLTCGCALPTLSPEVIRSDRRIRSAYEVELIRLNKAIAAGLVTGTAIEKRDAAWVILSVLAGGVTLARAVWDEALAEQISAAIQGAAIAIASGSLERDRFPSHPNQPESDAKSIGGSNKELQT